MAESKITIEKNGVRIQIPKSLVESHLNLGWWIVPVAEPEPESVSESVTEIEYVADPEYTEHTNRRRRRK